MQGLITKERGCIDSAAAPFAKDIGEVESLGLHEGSDLLEVVRYIYFWNNCVFLVNYMKNFFEKKKKVIYFANGDANFMVFCR